MCRVTPFAVTMLVGVLPTACAGGNAPPTGLADGSRATTSPIALEGAPSPQITTKVVAVDARRAARDTAAAGCLERKRDHPASGLVVARVGVNGASVTFRTTGDQSLIACDGSSGARDGSERWCGGAFSRVERGELQDPRLDLVGCATPAGKPVAFAWVRPGRRTSFVSVRQDGFVEVYLVAGDLPVRVTTTTGIDLGRSAASFEISEHDRAGKLLRAYLLDARVAG